MEKSELEELKKYNGKAVYINHAECGRGDRGFIYKENFYRFWFEDPSSNNHYVIRLKEIPLKGMRKPESVREMEDNVLSDLEKNLLKAVVEGKSELNTTMPIIINKRD